MGEDGRGGKGTLAGSPWENMSGLGETMPRSQILVQMATVFHEEKPSASAALASKPRLFTKSLAS